MVAVATVVWLYASNSSIQLAPISAPVSASRSRSLRPIHSVFPRPRRRTSPHRNRLPSRPRLKASMPEDSGMYRLNTPIVP